MQKRDNIEFIHFISPNICDNFIIFLKKTKSHLKISHKCCNGNGCGIYNCHYFVIKQLKFEFENSTYYTKAACTKTSEIDDICTVCHENTNNITLCNHHLCNSCNNQLRKKECPYCRQFF